MAISNAHGASIAPAGIILGVGLGGLLDGILLHQVLQWHSMLSARLPPDTMANMKTNMAADGFFHAVMLFATVTGVVLLWKVLKRRHELPPSGTAFTGYMLAGWGWFNLVEGTINHHILRLHHIVETAGLSTLDWLFLAFGVALIIVGHGVGRRAPT